MNKLTYDQLKQISAKQLQDYINEKGYITNPMW